MKVIYDPKTDTVKFLQKLKQLSKVSMQFRMCSTNGMWK